MFKTFWQLLPVFLLVTAIAYTNGWTAIAAVLFITQCVAVIAVVMLHLFDLLVLKTWPLKYASSGQYGRAIAIYSKLAQSRWVLAETRQVSTLGMAKTYHMKGDFDTSLNWLAKAVGMRLHASYIPYYHALHALNLLARQDNLDSAATHIELALESTCFRTRTDVLLPCYLSVLRRDLEVASELVQGYVDFIPQLRNEIRFPALLCIDAWLRPVFDNFVLGRYCLAVGREEEAKAHLSAAAQAPIDSCYRAQARSLLQALL